MYLSNLIKTYFSLIALLIFFCSSYPYFDSQVKLDLQNKIKGKVPQWITNQIASDLEGASPITHDMFEETFRNYRGYIGRYTIVNGKIDVQFNRSDWYTCPITPFMTFLLEELNNYVKLPNVDFLIVLDDKVFTDQCLVPILGFCKKINEKNILLVPDYQVFHTLQLDSSLCFVEYNILNKISEGIKLYPWTEKTQKAIWRGADTDGHYAPDNYFQYPRAKLLNLSNRFPDLLDAKFNVFHTRNNDMISKLYELNYIGSSMSMVEHIRYKYQVLMDGVTCSWPGAFCRFHSNSVVLKQNSDYIQWYYSLLKPYVHYIPFANNTEDLIEKIQWAIDNDEKAEQMVKNANEICANCLTYADILYYFYIVLNKYAKLQKS